MVGHNDTWYHQKGKFLEHMSLIGEGSRVHKKEMESFHKDKKSQESTRKVVSNIFRAAITDIKIGGAGIHLETLLALLATCSANIGNIGHSRKHLPDILNCIEKAVNSRVPSWLKTPLPSTLLSPHYWVTVDKGTPSRTTNQAILIVARDENGTPCPIPVDSPKVYTDVSSGSYSSLAEMVYNSITNNFGASVLSELVGVSADGPYQTATFRSTPLEQLNLDERVLITNLFFL